jgi:hypothetical protein
LYNLSRYAIAKVIDWFGADVVDRSVVGSEYQTNIVEEIEVLVGIPDYEILLSLFGRRAVKSDFDCHESVGVITHLVWMMSAKWLEEG